MADPTKSLNSRLALVSAQIVSAQMGERNGLDPCRGACAQLRQARDKLNDIQAEIDAGRDVENNNKKLERWKDRERDALEVVDDYGCSC